MTVRVHRRPLPAELRDLTLLSGVTEVRRYPGRPHDSPQALPPGHSIRAESQRFFTDPANLVEVGAPVLSPGLSATVSVDVGPPGRYLSPCSPGPVPCLDA